MFRIEEKFADLRPEAQLLRAILVDAQSDRGAALF
jgi:hypothetical protein